MVKKTAYKKSPNKFSEQEIVKAAIKLGAKKAKIVVPRRVVTGYWVRWKCCYGCTGYQSNLMCPPYTPTPIKLEMLDQYKRALLFEADRGQPKKIAVALEKRLFLQGFYKAFGLGAGPCNFARLAPLKRAAVIRNLRGLLLRVVASMYLPPPEDTALPLTLFTTTTTSNITSASC